MAKSHPVAPPSGFRHGGKTYKPGQRLPKKYARVVPDGTVSQDPARGIADAPPNFGRDMLPQILTFSGRFSTYSQVYRNPDIAYSQGPEQARIMRNDCAIMECLEARQRGTALLNWHIEPEDKKDDRQRQMADDLTDILQATPDFTEYRRNLLEAIWYGRYANQHAYGFRNIKGKKRVVVKRWSPINGDKLVFRYDDGTGKFSGDEVGIKVGLSYGRHDAIAGDRKIEMTDQGPAYFLEPWERTRIALHRHIIEDGVYEDALSAGRIHGVGVRDRIYWCWFQKQQTMVHLMDVIERTGSGFTIYYYPSGNAVAKEEVEELARNENYQNRIIMPRTPGDAAMDGYGIERIEPSSAGIDALKSVIHEFFGWQIKRYIIGQVLSSEAESTGMGSEVANLHQETMNAIVKYDAIKLEETMTRELLRPLQDFNPEFAWARDINYRFVIDTESANAEKKLAAVKSAFDMGLRIKATDVADMVGISMPSADDEVLQNPQMAGGGMQPGGMPGQPGAEGIQASDAFGPAMGGDEDAGGDEPADTTGPDGGDNPSDGGAPGVPGGDSPVGPVQYAAALGADPRWKTTHQPGETMTKGSHTYVLNAHHRWERQDKDEAAAANAETLDANSTPKGKPDEGGAMAKLGIDPTKPKMTGEQDRKKLADKMTGQPLLEPSHEDRHAHVSKALSGIDEQAGGLIRAFHEHPDYKSGGEVASQNLDPDHAAKLHSWLGQSAAKGDGPPIIMPDGTKLKSSHVGGGIAVDFGDGRTGFASEAGSFVVGKDGKANYTSKTGIVKSAMGGKPMLNQPGAQPNAATPPQANAAPQAGPAGPATPAPAQADTAPAWSPEQAKPADPLKKPGQVPAAPAPNPHRQNADKAQAEWQEAVKGMADAGKNGADAKDLAAWSRYVTHKRKVFREYDLAAKHHDKANKPGKGPPEGPKGETDDERVLREKFGIGTKTPVAQGVDPNRPRLGSPEDIAAARQPRVDDHAHHKALHETLSEAAANEPDDAKAASLAAQAVHHEALADHHSAAVHGPEVKAAMADAHQQLSGHSPAVHSAIQAAHEALHKSGLAEAPTAKAEPERPPEAKPEPAAAKPEPAAEPEPAEPKHIDTPEQAKLKKSVKWQLTNNSLHTHDQNVDAIHEAIERGHIKSADDLKNVLKAAKGIQEKGRLKAGHNRRTMELQKALAKSDDKGRRAIETELQKHEKLNPDENTHLAVKEALRRKMGRKERAPTVKPEAMLAEGAKKHGIEPEEYADLADHVWQTEGMNSPNRKPEGYADGVRALRQHTGIKSAAAAQNDDEKELSDETYMVFRDHPELGVSPDASPQEIEDAAWEILKSDDDGGTGIPSKNSPEYWAFADDAIRQIKEYEAANPPSQEDESVPFAARWRDGYTARQYAKQLSLWDENKHPRGMPENAGEFRPLDAAPAAEPKKDVGRAGLTKGEAMAKALDKSDAEFASYNQMVRATFLYTGTSPTDWKSVAVKGMVETPDDKGGMASMPDFDMPHDYKQVHTPHSSGPQNTCCELCGHDIKKAYWIQNDKDKLTMLVGSECVTNFGEGDSGERIAKKAQWAANRDLLAQTWDAFDKLGNKYGYKTQGGEHYIHAHASTPYYRMLGEMGVKKELDVPKDKQAELKAKSKEIEKVYADLRDILHNSKSAPVHHVGKSVKERRYVGGSLGYKEHTNKFDAASDAVVTKWVSTNGDKVRELLEKVDRLTGEGSDALRVAVHYAKKLKSTPGQKGIFDGYDHHGTESTDRTPYDEKKHSRGPGSQFRHIGPDDSKGQGKIGFDESKHPREAAGGEKGGQFTAAHHAVAKRFGIPPEAVKSVLDTHPDELAKRDSYFPPSSGRDEAVGPTLDYERHPLGTAKIDSSRHKTGDTDNAPVDCLREFDPHSLKLSEHEDGIRHAGSTEKYVEWLKAGHKPPPINVYDSSNGNGDLVSGNRRRTLAAQMANAGPITGWHGVENKETGLPLKYGDIKKAHAEAEGKKEDAFSLARPGEYQPPKAPPEEKPKASGGKQEALFHGLNDLPGQTKLFEGMDKGGGEKAEDDEEQPGKDLREMTRSEAAMGSIRGMMDTEGGKAIQKKISEAPSFAALKAAVDKARGKSSSPLEDPDDYLSHLEYNSKSATSQNIDKLQKSVIRESGIPLHPGGSMRGRSIDWHKAGVQNALAEGRDVSAEVLADYPDLKPNDDGPAPSPAVPKGPEPKWDGGASTPADDAAYARHASEMKAAGIATLPKAEWIARRDAILAKRKENLAKGPQQPGQKMPADHPALAKAKEWDAKNNAATITDVTPPGFGPGKPSADSVDAWPGPKHLTTEEQAAKRSTDEAKTILKGDISGDKRKAVEKSIEEKPVEKPLGPKDPMNNPPEGGWTAADEVPKHLQNPKDAAVHLLRGKPEPVAEPKPAPPAAKPFEDDPGTDDDTPPADETPRQTAERKSKSNYDESGDYAYARKSAVQNAGEDLLGSARHKRNAWRSLADAEKEGTAAELVTREHLLKNEPHGLIAKTTPANALSALAGHFALNAFPAAPFDEATLKAYSKAYVTREGHKAHHPEKEVRSRSPEELRKQYYDAYNDVKSEVEKAVAAGDEPNKVMQKVHDLTKRLIHKYRDATGSPDDYISGVTAADRFNPVANALVDLHNRAKPHDNPRRYKTNSVGGKLKDFADRLQKHYGSEPSTDMLEKAAGHAQDIMEGHSFNKTFGTVGTKAKEFNPADLYVKHATRKGGRVIDAKSVEAATKFMTSNLGMRGIQYGNSVTDDERQHHLQKTSEAFADLMDVTGLDDKHASMDGKLGIAFGARGHGTASAHYEPGKQVINLTRKDGVGTLAHEWGHFFDHSLTGFDKSKAGGKDGYQSNRHTGEGAIHEAYEDLRKTWQDSGFNRRLNTHVIEQQQAGKMSDKKAEYWKSNHEKFARCFERYVQHKLKADGRENTYLSGMDKGHELWPTDEEVAKMAPKFDAIFKAYRDKTND